MLLTVKKIGPVLDLFSAERPEWGVSEVAAAVGMPKSTTHSLLSSLAEVGLLTCTSRSRYRLGWRCLNLGETLRVSLDLRQAALPAMRKLAQRYGETVQLGVLDRGRVLYLDRVEATHAVRVIGPRLGSRLPAHATALGKVVLAARPAGDVARIAQAEGLIKLTPPTLATLAELQAELDRVRRQGYAYEMEETIPDVASVAAPIHHDRGMVVAALGVSAPAWRFQRHSEELRKSLMGAVDEVSRCLSRDGGPQPKARLAAPRPPLTVASPSGGDRLSSGRPSRPLDQPAPRSEVAGPTP